MFGHRLLGKWGVGLTNSGERNVGLTKYSGENEHWFDKVLWEDECDYFVKISVDLTKCSEILGVDKQTILRKRVGILAKNLSETGWD